MTKVIDFDAFRAEQKAEPLSLRLGGHDYPLPTSLPATLAVDIIRRNADNASEEMDPAELLTMGESIFGGPEAFMKLLTDNQITTTELPDLFKMVFEAYNAAAGEPEAPNPESLPASTQAQTASSL